MAEAESNAKGLSGSLRQLLEALMAMAQNRLELASLELSEEKFRLLEVLFLGAVLLCFGLLAAMVFTATVIILLWEVAGPSLLIGLTVVYAAIAMAAWLALRKRIRNWTPPLSATVEEFKKDRQCLRLQP